MRGLRSVGPKPPLNMGGWVFPSTVDGPITLIDGPIPLTDGPIPLTDGPITFTDGQIFQFFQIRILKKVLREPGSNGPKIHRK